MQPICSVCSLAVTLFIIQFAYGCYSSKRQGRLNSSVWSGQNTEGHSLGIISKQEPISYPSAHYKVFLFNFANTQYFLSIGITKKRKLLPRYLIKIKKLAFTLFPSPYTVRWIPSMSYKLEKKKEKKSIQTMNFTTLRVNVQHVVE